MARNKGLRKPQVKVSDIRKISATANKAYRSKKWAERGDRYNERYAQKQQTKRARSSEYYKTKRTAARSAAVASTISASENARANAAKTEAQERTKQITAARQYAQLINGNQGAGNIVNPNDDSGTKNPNNYNATDLY